MARWMCHNAFTLSALVMPAADGEWAVLNRTDLITTLPPSNTPSPPPPHTPRPGTMSYFRITLHRSAIGLPERTRGVLAALGLRRRMQTVFHPVHPQFAGMILKVKELVRVQEVDRALSKQEVKAERTPDKGFYVEKAVPRL
ncbi:hypothetical protein BGZ61DRAFT_531691 [Ilyonectria robusta]|uniref:uncharacterized protein n=1 Tax=Ilyonectria robusta TaxID=1079257 RepID=UPI001E8DC521|nr:uncharacterized protein BGZ61DRAFT_531691 [Ilyonectria robusta]KAH8706510.1 hypothetical protein BGZ61DRAFT_531691 [Ilyonectria robusta]